MSAIGWFTIYTKRMLTKASLSKSITHGLKEQKPYYILECIAKQIMTTANQILMEIVYSVPFMSESKIYAKRG